ncbi:hypothetical protein ACFSVJ_31410 [Prauserella oleivorans]
MATAQARSPTSRIRRQVSTPSRRFGACGTLSARLAACARDGIIDVLSTIDAFATLARATGWLPRLVHVSATPDGAGRIQVRIETGIVVDHAVVPGHGLPPPSLTRRLLDACTQDWGAEDSAGRVCFWADLVLSVVRPRPEVRPLSITVAFDSRRTDRTAGGDGRSGTSMPGNLHSREQET